MGVKEAVCVLVSKQGYLQVKWRNRANWSMMLLFLHLLYYLPELYLILNPPFLDLLWQGSYDGPSKG